MSELGGEFVSDCGRSLADDIMASINSAGYEADQLASLMEVLADHLGQAPQKVDPLRTARTGEDVARIAQGLSARLSDQMAAAEEYCCALRCGKRAPA